MRASLRRGVEKYGRRAGASPSFLLRAVVRCCAVFFAVKGETGTDVRRSEMLAECAGTGSAKYGVVGMKRGEYSYYWCVLLILFGGKLLGSSLGRYQILKNVQ